jgi:hypothetical protein
MFPISTEIRSVDVLPYKKMKMKIEIISLFNYRYPRLTTFSSTSTSHKG